MKSLFFLSIIALSAFTIQATQINPQACIQDVLSLASSLQSLKNDLSTFNIGDIALQIQNIEAVIPQIKADCLSSYQLEFNPIACIEDIKSAVADVQKLIAEIKSGDVNFSNYIAQVEELVTLVKKVTVDCSTSISIKLNNYLQFNPVSCLADVKSFVQTVQALETDLQTENVVDIIAQITALEQEIPHLKSDCLSATQLEFNPIACVQDVIKAVQLAQKLVSEIKAGDVNLSDYLTQVQQLVALAKQAQTDCSSSTTEQLQFNPENCIVDVENLYHTIQSLETDIQSENILDIIAQIKNLELEIPALQTDCLSTNAQLAFNPIACVQDVTQAIQLAQQLVSEIKAGDTNISNYLAQVQSLIALVQKAKADCSTSTAKKFLN